MRSLSPQVNPTANTQTNKAEDPLQNVIKHGEEKKSHEEKRRYKFAHLNLFAILGYPNEILLRSALRHQTW
jgi:hypothetical protein